MVWLRLSLPDNDDGDVPPAAERNDWDLAALTFGRDCPFGL